MKDLTFTYLTPFGGSGLGAYGVGQGEITLPNHGVRARWECLGGFDIDETACADFEYLNGVPQLLADIRKLTTADIRRAYGKRAPDMVLSSAPCQGGSGLLSAEKAKSQKYQDLNELALIWAELMIGAWDSPPPLLLFENVPRLVARAPKMIAKLRRLLRRAGYVLHEGFHDCGELGGLAQHRHRWLLVARKPDLCPPLLYQPPKRRVRGCGDVLGQLPMPGTIDAKPWGKMHELPRLSWLNWVRLALIPAGGDWRDLEGVLAEGQERRELFKRHGVEAWDQPTGTIAAGLGSNGVRNVADPRIAWFRGVYGVSPWAQASGTITTAATPSHGRYSVADPRLTCAPRAGAYGVQDWAKASRAITAHLEVDNGRGAVADPRVDPGFDPSVKRAFDAGYAVLEWRAAARTIAGISSVGCGAYAVADPRIDETPTDGGNWAGDPKKPPPFVPVIIAEDGTWHRPLTTLELAALQGFPLRVRGEALKLSGESHTRWRKAIGNAIPGPTAQAIGERMLVALAEGALGAFSLSSGAVWVAPELEVSHG
jgi:site-specific DNA-cytosine methylase